MNSLDSYPQSPLSCSANRELFILVVHLLTTIAKLLGPDGARAIIADSPLIKQQLLIINRHRKRASRLTPLDRFLLGLWSLFLIHRRIQQAAVIITPSTLLKSHQWQANLRILDVEEIKCVPYTPTSHPFIERLIGTIHREFLDNLFFWNTHDLERKLESFRQYYNQH